MSKKSCEEQKKATFVNGGQKEWQRTNSRLLQSGRNGRKSGLTRDLLHAMRCGRPKQFQLKREIEGTNGSVQVGGWMW
jgi:hypothetical protein